MSNITITGQLPYKGSAVAVAGAITEAFTFTGSVLESLSITGQIDFTPPAAAGTNILFISGEAILFISGENVEFVA